MVADDMSPSIVSLMNLMLVQECTKGFVQRRMRSRLHSLVEVWDFLIDVVEEEMVVYGGHMKVPKVLVDIVESVAAAVYVDCWFDLPKMWVNFSPGNEQEKRDYFDYRNCAISELGIVSQCCRPQHVMKLSKQYFENVSMKINVKVGGRNSVLSASLNGRLSYVTDRPTIIFGADVTRPAKGEDSTPSIADVVASMDWAQVSKYKALVSAQPHTQEIIQDLHTTSTDSKRGVIHGEMIRSF